MEETEMEFMLNLLDEDMKHAVVIDGKPEIFVNAEGLRRLAAFSKRTDAPEAIENLIKLTGENKNDK